MDLMYLVFLLLFAMLGFCIYVDRKATTERRRQARERSWWEQSRDRSQRF